LLLKKFGHPYRNIAITQLTKNMKLSEIKTALRYLKEVSFVLPNGETVPTHFHVTEVGLSTKHFIDCGGTVREEQTVNFQLYTATDYDHRLSTEKLSSIIELSEKTLILPDAQIEVEFQGRTIEKYGLAFVNGQFHLKAKKTDCLAKEQCGIPVVEQNEPVQVKACTPGSGCSVASPLLVSRQHKLD